MRAGGCRRIDSHRKSNAQSALGVEMLRASRHLIEQELLRLQGNPASGVAEPGSTHHGDRIPQREVAPPSHSQDARHVRDQLPDNPEHGEDDGGEACSLTP